MARGLQKQGSEVRSLNPRISGGAGTMRFRTMFMMAVTIFCGAGAGIFLTINDESLFGTYLYTFFPFAVALLFLAIGYEIIYQVRSEATSEKEEKASANSRKEEKPFSSHHPKAA